MSRGNESMLGLFLRFRSQVARRSGIIALGFAAIWWGYVVGQRWVHVEHVELPVGFPGYPG